MVTTGILVGTHETCLTALTRQGGGLGRFIQFQWLTPSHQPGYLITSVSLRSPLHSLEVRLIQPSLPGQWGNIRPSEGTIRL